MTRWPTQKIEEVATKVGMGPFGSSIKVSTFAPQGVPIISGQHLHGARISEEESFNFLTNDHAEQLANANVYRGDVIFTHAGNIGQVSYVPPNSSYSRYVISQRQFFMRCDVSKVIPEFVTYYFRSPIGQHLLLANRSSSGVPSIARPVTYLRTIEIPIPPLNEQSAIAAVLGALDDKIDQNRRTARALERLARAIFRAWFVDFEPVKAKATGATSFPSIPKSVFDALPTQFVDSEIGPVPEGWGVAALTNLFQVNPPRSLLKGELAPHLDMRNMPTDGHSPDQVGVRPFGSGARFTNGDTLVARITPCLENGKTAFVDFLKDGEIAWGSTEYIVLKPHPPIPPIFAYLLARTGEFRSFAIQAMTGTSGRQRVPFTALDHFSIAAPPAYMLAALGDLVEPLIARSSAATRESRSLAQLRDLLLPRLFSGELRVSQEAHREGN